MRLHVFAGENASLKFQACQKHSPLCQSCNSSNGQLAVGLSQSGLSYLNDGDPHLWRGHQVSLPTHFWGSWAGHGVFVIFMYCLLQYCGRCHSTCKIC